MKLEWLEQEMDLEGLDLVRVGRREGNEIRLFGLPDVSREHGRFFRGQDSVGEWGWYYADEHSTNGSLHNGTKVLDCAVKISPGDVVVLGIRKAGNPFYRLEVKW